MTNKNDMPEVIWAYRPVFEAGGNYEADANIILNRGDYDRVVAYVRADTRPVPSEVVEAKAYTALKEWPRAGMGEKKVKEVMVFVNTHQDVLIKGLELLSGKTRSEVIDEALSLLTAQKGN